MNKFIGNRSFYRRLFTVMIPVLIQNVITNFVNLLDNVMVGQVGTEPMSGVAIVNRLIFVFNLCIFGGLAGAGIFTAQYYGKGDKEGIRNTVRAKLYIAAATVVIFSALFLLFDKQLISLFIHEGEEALDLEATLYYGRDYLKVMLIQLIPFAISQVYSSTLRETGETVLPMKAGIAAVFVNMTFNYILIFGKFGAPKLGVVGAAIATVLSRFVECAIVVTWTNKNKARYTFADGLFRTMMVPKPLVKQIAVKGLPLLVNELFWSSGMTTLDQCYSMRGLEVISALNISGTVSNLFYCSFFAMGTTIAILVGQLLGAGETEKAVDEARKLTAFSVVLCAAVGVIMILLAPLVPRVYNTTDSVKTLAAGFLTVCAVLMPVNSYTNSCYFTLRSGGKTLITFVFDSMFIWAVLIPIAMLISRLTSMPIMSMYILISAMDIVKAYIGHVFIRQCKWVNNIVGD